VNTNLSALTALSSAEMESVNGGDSALWREFWDGVLQDLRDFKQGCLDGFWNP
jgi:hypothetical protein